MEERIDELIYRLKERVAICGSNTDSLDIINELMLCISELQKQLESKPETGLDESVQFEEPQNSLVISIGTINIFTSQNLSPPPQENK